MGTQGGQLENAIGYRFDEPALLEVALTHRSAGGENNERLEFLGDAILAFVISVDLFRRFPQADEGTMSRLRASLVKRESLARIARALQLGEFLRLGSGEMKSGGHRRESILADALEAVIGAVYLDGGIDAGRGLVLRLFEQQLEGLSPDSARKDPKTRLQEFLQARRRALPVYHVHSVTGEAHQQTFAVACEVDGLDEPVEGVGSSRRKAEQTAAEEALRRLQHD